MKVQLKIKMKDDSYLEWGQPETESEFNEMYLLRLELYRRKNLISNTKLKLDTDYADTNGCHYFVCRYLGRFIGSTRMIYNQKLPTEELYFDIDLPEELKNAPVEHKVEIGRLTSSLKDLPKFIPRHLVVIGLFKVMLDFSYENGYYYAIGTVKEHVKNRFDLIDFPVTYFSYKGIKYNPKIQEDPLDNFFDTNLTGGLFPMYIHVDNIALYVNSFLENKYIFYKLQNKVYRLNSKLAYDILLYFKIARRKIRRCLA